MPGRKSSGRPPSPPRQNPHTPPLQKMWDSSPLGKPLTPRSLPGYLAKKVAIPTRTASEGLDWTLGKKKQRDKKKRNKQKRETKRKKKKKKCCEKDRREFGALPRRVSYRLRLQRLLPDERVQCGDDSKDSLNRHLQDKSKDSLNRHLRGVKRFKANRSCRRENFPLRS